MTRPVPARRGFITVLFTLPFLVLSGYAGQYADRFSKRTMIVLLKWVEVAIMGGACVALSVGEYWAVLAALLLMAAQSAFFGPAKYGVIPEIVAETRLSRANGTVNMMTNVAVIGGIILGGHLSLGYSAGVGTIGATLVVLALVGTAISTTIRPLRAANPTLRIRSRLAAPVIESFRAMSSDRSLLRVAFSWAFFYFVAAVVISAFPDYGSALFGGGTRPSTTPTSPT